MNKLIMKLMNLLMLSCRKATELIEKKMYFQISGKEKIQLALHKSICDACTAYELQSRLIDKALRHKSENIPPISLSNNFKENILKLLNK